MSNSNFRLMPRNPILEAYRHHQNFKVHAGYVLNPVARGLQLHDNRNWRLVKFSDVMHGKHDPARLGLVQGQRGQGRQSRLSGRSAAPLNEQRSVRLLQP